MAITTYAELQTAVGNWLMRPDLTSQIPDFITLSEAQMQRDLQDHYKMEATTSLAATSRYTSLPADFMEPKRLYMTGANRALLPTTQSEMQDMRYSSEDAAGTECYYTITAAQIEIYPTPASDTLELTYIAKFAALSDSNTSNWILADAPDAYLYGALLQTAPFLDQDERLLTWTALYDKAITGLRKQSERAKWGGQKLRMR